MADDPKNDPGTRMRNMLGGSSPMLRLPKKKRGDVSFLPKLPASPIKNDSPTIASKPASFTQQTSTSIPARKFNIGPAFWTIASIISLTVNVVLLAILLVAFSTLRNARLTNVTALGTDLLGGLYTNFEKMDRAHITTNIPVQTTIPVKFDLQLNQQTNVILSQDVTIDNAVVTVKTGGLNISRALTTIILPQGTTLPVYLNLTVPVDTTVPVTLNVPVDIPLEQTQLHEPFVGLRDVVGPFYCFFKRDAMDMNNQLICK